MREWRRGRGLGLRCQKHGGGGGRDEGEKGRGEDGGENGGGGGVSSGQKHRAVGEREGVFGKDERGEGKRKGRWVAGEVGGETMVWREWRKERGDLDCGVKWQKLGAGGG